MFRRTGYQFMMEAIIFPIDFEHVDSENTNKPIFWALIAFNTEQLV